MPDDRCANFNSEIGSLGPLPSTAAQQGHCGLTQVDFRRTALFETYDPPPLPTHTQTHTEQVYSLSMQLAFACLYCAVSKQALTFQKCRERMCVVSYFSVFALFTNTLT